jgi:hypothetical protein
MVETFTLDNEPEVHAVAVQALRGDPASGRMLADPARRGVINRPIPSMINVNGLLIMNELRAMAHPWGFARCMRDTDH